MENTAHSEVEQPATASPLDSRLTWETPTVIRIDANAAESRASGIKTHISLDGTHMS